MGSRWALAATVGLLAARNVTERWSPAGSYVPVNAALGAVLVGVARAGGSSWAELGLARRRIRDGLRIGGMAAAAAAAVMALGAALPATRPLFDDERVEVDQDRRELLYQTLLRIPAGTVAFEEIAFRGALLSLLRHRLPVPAAVAVDSALFGLWHIAPTVSLADANGITGARVAALVAGSVVVTGIGGAALCALRIRGGHIVAPALLHLAINDVGFLLAWWTRT